MIDNVVLMTPTPHKDMTSDNLVGQGVDAMQFQVPDYDDKQI